MQVAKSTRKKHSDYDKLGFMIARTQLSKITEFNIVKSTNLNPPNPKMVDVICFNQLFEAINNRASIYIIVDGSALTG